MKPIVEQDAFEQLHWLFRGLTWGGDGHEAERHLLRVIRILTAKHGTRPFYNPQPKLPKSTISIDGCPNCGYQNLMPSNHAEDGVDCCRCRQKFIDPTFKMRQEDNPF